MKEQKAKQLRQSAYVEVPILMSNMQLIASDARAAGMYDCQKPAAAAEPMRTGELYL